VSATNAAGAETTLEVRVNDVQWHEADSLYTAESRLRAYISRRADDGKVTVMFGDGVNGARLPTGNENVTAVYRTGIGTPGLLNAGQLSLLLTRPLGVKNVTNPLPTAGAADPESRDNARENAPFTVLTLDRIVSLRDFEDFARAFAGIGKTQATYLWDGEARVLHLTVASAAPNPSSAGDYTIDPKSDLFKNLRLAMDAARDTMQRLEVDTYAPRYFRVRARVLVAADYLPEKVQAAVSAALLDTYAFERRSFGQPVFASEVLGVMQGVEVVTASFLTALHLRGNAVTRESRLTAARALPVPGPGGALLDIEKAQLLLIDLTGIDITAEVAS
jgi:predicted phage baseplate assembly protein